MNIKKVQKIQKLKYKNYKQQYKNKNMNYKKKDKRIQQLQQRTANVKQGADSGSSSDLQSKSNRSPTFGNLHQTTSGGVEDLLLYKNLVYNLLNKNIIMI